MKVVALPEVRQYLNELIEILYEKDYFSYLESSENYVEQLFDDIKTTLHNRPKRYAPVYFDRYGKNMYYSIFRKSPRTQWYVFFNVYANNNETIYLIRYISNNHVIAQHL